jgi:uncharacterized protein
MRNMRVYRFQRLLASTLCFVCILMELGGLALRAAAQTSAYRDKLSNYSDQPVFDVQYSPLPESVVEDKGVHVTMRDGIWLNVNVYRPKTPGRYPVIMALTPYGIDRFRDLDEVFGVIQPGMTMKWNMGKIRVSDHTIFEGPDPGYWVPQGYVVVDIDTRGQGQSQGAMAMFGGNTDWWDLMDWMAKQDWSTGEAAIHGVSALCMTQWSLLSHPPLPPQYKAAVCWEGINETGAGTGFGGIPELGFGKFIGTLIGPAASPNAAPRPNGGGPGGPGGGPTGGQNGASGGPGGPGRPGGNPGPMGGGYNLDVMNLPSLICSTFSDQEMHDRDTFAAYMRMATPAKDKYLYVHRETKWGTYYSPEALELQKKFLDRYLKHDEHALDGVSHVRFQINNDRYDNKVYHADQWPLEGTAYSEKYIDAQSGKLVDKLPSLASTVSVTPEQPESESNRGTFDYRFDRDTNVVGYMKLKLWVEAVDSNDADLFVGVQKVDASGRVIYMLNGESGAEINRPIAMGWLRVSSRELDPKISTTFNPVRLASTHPGTPSKLLSPGEIVPVEIAILPSGTLFKKGESLRVVVQSRPISPLNTMRVWDYKKTGTARIHSGGQYDSYLLVPEWRGGQAR